MSETPIPSNRKDPKEVLASFWSFMKAAGAALLIRFLVISPFVIPSGSMIPTLLVGDYLFVTCFSYGYSKFTIPFGYKLPGFEGRILAFQKPKHGDVIVFRPPYNTKMDYVKRVIGVPGDKVQVQGGRVILNGKPLPLKKIGPYKQRADEHGRFVEATLYEETFPSGKKHFLIKQAPFGQGDYDNTPIYEVPEGHYFVIGDNRDGSSDSRAMHAIGFVPYDHLVGTPLFLFFSTDGRASWWEFWKWIPSMRFSRFGDLIS